MIELDDAVKQCVERLRRYRHTHRVGEQNTKAGLIEPVIAALGWDVLDPDEVHREYRRRSGDNPVDYALLLLRTPRLFIEAKGLGENLDDPRWANQTISYAAVAGVEWVALTDGAEWRVYNAHAPVPVEQKLFRAVRLEHDVEAACDLLSLLSKDNMRENRIEELWNGFFVDRQVHAELIKLFSDGEPASELVALLDRRLSKLTREEIRLSLMRARASFDFPSGNTTFVQAPVPLVGTSPAGTAVSSDLTAHPVPPPASADGMAVRDPGRPRVSRPRVSPEERRVRISDMIAAGRLIPGAVLHATYFGRNYTAELLGDGTVRYQGRVYTSLSAAGEAVKITRHGLSVDKSKIATDGMDFWQTSDARGGDVVSLKEIRRRTSTDRNR